MKNKINFAPPVADVLFAVLFIILSFFKGGRMLRDGDTGWHIRAGEFMIDTLSVPKTDIFSFRPPFPWMPHTWLSEVIMAAIHRASGLTGVVIFFSFLIALTYFLLFKMMRRYGGNILAAIVIALLGLAASILQGSTGPHFVWRFLFVAWY